MIILWRYWKKRTGRMRLQTDLEFKQNQILKLNNEFNVGMFHTRLRGGKAFAAEQKIWEFKKLLLRSKCLQKQEGKRLQPNDLVRKATQHMNQTISTKYALAPETIEKRSLNPNGSKYFQEIYDFMRLKKPRIIKWETKKEIRSPLNLDEKVLVFIWKTQKERCSWKFI